MPRERQRQWVYLHEDGPLHYLGPRVRTIEEFLAPEVLAAWHVNLHDRLEVWSLAVESAALWCSPFSTRALISGHRLTAESGREFAAVIGVTLERVRWGWRARCAHHPGSPVGEDETPLLAMADLARHLGFREGIPVGADHVPTFRQLVARQNRDKPMQA